MTQYHVPGLENLTLLFASQSKRKKDFMWKVSLFLVETCLAIRKLSVKDRKCQSIPGTIQEKEMSDFKLMLYPYESIVTEKYKELPYIPMDPCELNLNF